MNSDHYTYGRYHGEEAFIDQQPSYLPQSNFGGERFIAADDSWTEADAATQDAFLLAGHLSNSWDGHEFYQGTSGGSSVVNQVDTVFLPSDGGGGGVPETHSQTSFYLPPTHSVAYPTSADFEGLFDHITFQSVEPPFTAFTSNGVQHYRCDCGHETRRRGDMLRHRESSKHSDRKHHCSLCEKWFTRQDGLRRHIRTMHPQSESDPHRHEHPPH
ncbi:hypothetical protein APHAL10511_008665 [Amanita phalloides]|nr:hypothetical protein APHAL10511_008665 [Amanita phalloides]